MLREVMLLSEREGQSLMLGLGTWTHIKSRIDRKANELVLRFVGSLCLGLKSVRTSIVPAILVFAVLEPRYKFRLVHKVLEFEDSDWSFSWYCLYLGAVFDRSPDLCRLTRYPLQVGTRAKSLLKQRLLMNHMNHHRCRR